MKRGELFLLNVSIAVIAVCCALLLLTGCSNPASPDDPNQLSPHGLFWINPGEYGPPGPEMGALAESRWHEVESCLNLYFTPNRFLVTLHTGPWTNSQAQYVGGEYHLRTSVEVIATDVQSFKHEFMHYLLDVKTGDPDYNHTRGGLVVYGPHGESQGADWLRCTVN